MELFLVVVLLSVMTAMVVPRFKRTTEGLRLQNCAFNFYKLVYFAKEQSLTQGREFRILLEYPGAAYQLLSRESSTFVPAKGRWGRKMQIPEGISFQGKASQVTCYPDGRCDAASVRFSDDSGGYEVSVENFGGLIRMREI